MAATRKRAPRKAPTRKSPPRAGGMVGLRTAFWLVVVGCALYGGGIVSGLMKPPRLFASSVPAPPTVRSSAHVPAPHVETEAQPAGVARRAKAAEEEASPLPSQAHPVRARPSASPRMTAASTPSAERSPKAAATTTPNKPVAMVTPPPPRPSAVPDARAAIIIDDCGNNNTPTQAFLDAPAPVTLAILPHLAFSRQIAIAAHEHGKGVMLHFPMEASGGQNPGPGTLRVAMSDDEKLKVIHDNLAAVPDLEGVNNHEGSKATTDAHTMSLVLKAVRDQGMFWVDSMTTPDSCAYEVATKVGLPFARRDVFIDNVDEIEPIKAQLRLLIREARAHGSAIGIGHARTNTATAFTEMIPAFEEAGVKLVLVKDLTHLPKEDKR